MRLANRYVVGDGVEQTPKTAFHIYKKLAVPMYQKLRNLGFMFELGDGAEQNLEKAAVMYQYSCNLKNEDGCSK